MKNWQRYSTKTAIMGKSVTGQSEHTGWLYWRSKTKESSIVEKIFQKWYIFARCMYVWRENILVKSYIISLVTVCKTRPQKFLYATSHTISPWMLFSVRADGKVSKPETNFRPPRTQKKTIWTIFSVLVDGNLSTHGAIFRPWRTENSLRCAYVSVPAAGMLSSRGQRGLEAKF